MKEAVKHKRFTSVGNHQPRSPIAEKNPLSHLSSYYLYNISQSPEENCVQGVRRVVSGDGSV